VALTPAALASVMDRPARRSRSLARAPSRNSCHSHRAPRRGRVVEVKVSGGKNGHVCRESLSRGNKGSYPDWTSETTAAGEKLGRCAIELTGANQPLHTHSLRRFPCSER